MSESDMVTVRPDVGSRARSHTTVALLITVAISTAACLQDESPAAPVSTSAVEVLWEVGGSEDLGDVLMLAARSAAFGPGGLIAIADQGVPGLFVLDGNGSIRAQRTMRGSGPGELQAPWFVGFRGDTLWLWDFGQARLTWFDQELNVLRTQSTGPKTPYEGTNRINGGGELLAGEWMLEYIGDPSMSQSEPVQPPLPVLLRDPDGELIEVASMAVPGPSYAAVPQQSSAYPLPLPQPLDARPIVRADPGGEWFFTLDRTPSSDPKGMIQIALFNSTGDEIDQIAIPYEALPVDQEATLASIRNWLEAALPASLLGEVVLEDDGLWWLPRNATPVQDALVFDEGILLQRERFQEDTSWEWYDLEGSLNARFFLPPDLRILAASEGRMVVAGVDSLNTTFVRLYRMRGEDVSGGVAP